MAKVPQKVSREVSQKYFRVDNTFLREVKDNPCDRISLEIGDSKQPDTFYPQAKLKRWDNEVNASFRYVDKEAGEAQIHTEGNVIKYIKPKVEFHAYDLDAGDVGEDGGLELELILKEKPDINTFDFTVQKKELNFYYQPALTPEEIEEGAERPIDVEGSYAVYHATKGGMNRADGMEYKTGKAFHIYRPFAHDANGNGVYGDLSLDEEKGVLTVTIDQEFLNSAVYPVVVDPTFGYTSIGGSLTLLARDNGSTVLARSTRHGNNVTLSDVGTWSLDKISAYIRTGSSVFPLTTDLTFFLNEEDSGGSGIHDQIASGETTDIVIDDNTPELVEITTSGDNFTDGTYVLNAVANGEKIGTGGGTRDIYLVFDNTGSQNEYSENFDSNYSGSKEDPWTETASSNDDLHSIYATYTAGVGTEPEIVLDTNTKFF